MKKTYFFLLISIFIISCTNSGNKSTESDDSALEKQADVTLTQAWATDSVFKTPESVLVDKTRDVIYVSNVNMNPWEKDGNGFLSKIDRDGNIIELEWVTGLHGPKGMGVIGDKLYVADIDALIEIEIESGTILNSYPVEGEPALNDITVGSDGTVYISGSSAQKVFAFKDGEIHVYLEGDLGRPNGLFAEPDRLLMLSSGSSELVSIDPSTKKKTHLAGGFGHGDGIVSAGESGYFASDWQGELFFVSPDWKTTLLLDTRDQKINAADIDVLLSEKLVLVPTFFDNRVVAYKYDVK